MENNYKELEFTVYFYLFCQRVLEYTDCISRRDVTTAIKNVVS